MQNLMMVKTYTELENLNYKIWCSSERSPGCI